MSSTVIPEIDRDLLAELLEDILKACGTVVNPENSHVHVSQFSSSKDGIKKRTWITAKGKEIVSYLTDEQCELTLQKMTGHSFARSLLNKKKKYGSWTKDQEAWAHKVATQGFDRVQARENQSQDREKKDGFRNIWELMQRQVEAGVKSPSIKCLHNGDLYQLSWRKGSRQGGSRILVTSCIEGSIFGQIVEGDCSYQPRRENSQRVMDFLVAMEDDPADIVSKSGRETGRCCFCRRRLKNDSNMRAGYGYNCAVRHGLKDKWLASSKENVDTTSMQLKKLL